MPSSSVQIRLSDIRMEQISGESDRTLISALKSRIVNGGQTQPDQTKIYDEDQTVVLLTLTPTGELEKMRITANSPSEALKNGRVRKALGLDGEGFQADRDLQRPLSAEGKAYIPIELSKDELSKLLYENIKPSPQSKREPYPCFRGRE